MVMCDVRKVRGCRVLNKTHKFLCDRKAVKELQAAKVISSGQSCSRVVQVSCVHVSFVGILRPHTDHFLS